MFSKLAQRVTIPIFGLLLLENFHYDLSKIAQSSRTVHIVQSFNENFCELFNISLQNALAYLRLRGTPYHYVKNNDGLIAT